MASGATRAVRYIAFLIRATARSNNLELPELWERLGAELEDDPGTASRTPGPGELDFARRALALHRDEPDLEPDHGASADNGADPDCGAPPDG